MNHIRNVVILILLAIAAISCHQNNKGTNSFIAITKGNIVEDPGFSQGAAWADIDNDGDEDLFVTNSWTNGNNLFYRNNGDGTFNKNPDIIIANDGGNSNGCTWGDVDNNGTPDLYVANVNNQPNFFYLNNGDGTFLKVTSGNAATDNEWSYTCAWADYNNDGWLDLFVGNYNGQPNSLYKNDGTGNLIKITEKYVTTDSSSTQGCVWFDYNNDGWLDLYVANKEQNYLYRNRKDGHFEKISDIAPVSDNGNSFGCSAADYNNDGLTDLFVANWWGKNHLYKNEGNESFKKIIGSPATEEALNSEGSSWGDFDNDGDLDLFVTNDGYNSIFENIDGQFTKLEYLTPAIDSSNSNGITWNDIDNDGDLDIFIANGGNQHNQLYQNSGNSNHWLKIKCIGAKSNYSAIGAKVTIYQNSNKQTREVTGQTGGGYGAQNGLILHFGLGLKEKIDSLIILWPSKTKLKIVEPNFNNTIMIKEE